MRELLVTFYKQEPAVIMSDRDSSSVKIGKVQSAPQLLKSSFQSKAHTSKFSTDNSSKSHARYADSSVLPVYAILESELAFYVIHPHIQHSLYDIVTFSPYLIGSCSVKPMFILYQLLQGMRFCHRHGTSIGEVNLQDLLVDQNLWLQLMQPPNNNISHAKRAEMDEKSSNRTKGHPLSSQVHHSKYKIEHLADLTKSWIFGELSNFDYLMVLNHLAGRRMCDPNQHPVMPWVMDFTSPASGLRDLTKSKYRLNKGDRQLDLTYDVATLGSSQENVHVPHHISDVLSDITYYVYKARRTPKSVLCAHVRSKWVPHEYPSSMQRLQEWTPDECIPEFYTDPAIFTSIHEDLPDLEIPSWANGVEDFVHKHRTMLEGEHVSQKIHHWIDLTFGYKVKLSTISTNYYNNYKTRPSINFFFYGNHNTCLD